MTTRQAIAACPLLAAASPDTTARLADCGMVRRLACGEVLVSEHLETQSIHFMLSGYAVLYRNNLSGDRKNIFIQGPGELLNETCLEQPVASCAIQAMCDGEMLSFARARFLSIMKGDAAFAQAVLCAGMKKLRRLYRQLGNTTNMCRLEQQVASKLWKMARDFGKDGDGGRTIAFDLSITFLADMVGSKRETISRVVTSLREQGVIETQHKTFCIRDMEALRRICENTGRARLS